MNKKYVYHVQERFNHRESGSGVSESDQGLTEIH